jgi:hypothetical protein
MRLTQYFGEISPKRNERCVWKNEMKKLCFGETLEKAERATKMKQGIRTGNCETDSG